MFRSAVTSYLIAMSLAGPGLCCCSFKRAAAVVLAFAASCHGQKMATPSCCHAGKDKQPSGKPDTCPCRQHREQPVLSLNSGSTSSDAFGADRSGLTCEPAMAVLDPLEAGDTDHLVQQALDSPYPNSRGLLRALSVMRC